MNLGNRLLLLIYYVIWINILMSYLFLVILTLSLSSFPFINFLKVPRWFVQQSQNWLHLGLASFKPTVWCRWSKFLMIASYIRTYTYFILFYFFVVVLMEPLTIKGHKFLKNYNWKLKEYSSTFYLLGQAQRLTNIKTDG